MDPIILTPRLKLTLLTSAPPGSQELNWIHQLRSNEKSGFWSLGGPAKSLEQTTQALFNILPMPSTNAPPPADENQANKSYRIAYLVHTQTPDPDFTGMITLRSLSSSETARPPRLTHASTAQTLSLELAYMFLPGFWGQGFATEAICAMLDACARAKAGFWEPWEGVWVRAIVNAENGASRRVMAKCGMGEPEDVSVLGNRVWVAGKWTVDHELCVFGKRVVG